MLALQTLRYVLCMGNVAMNAALVVYILYQITILLDRVVG